MEDLSPAQHWVGGARVEGAPEKVVVCQPVPTPAGHAGGAEGGGIEEGQEVCQDAVIQVSRKSCAFHGDVTGFNRGGVPKNFVRRVMSRAREERVGASFRDLLTLYSRSARTESAPSRSLPDKEVPPALVLWRNAEMLQTMARNGQPEECRQQMSLQ